MLSRLQGAATPVHARWAQLCGDLQLYWHNCGKHFTFRKYAASFLDAGTGGPTDRRCPNPKQKPIYGGLKRMMELDPTTFCMATELRTPRGAANASGLPVTSSAAARPRRSGGPP